MAFYSSNSFSNLESSPQVTSEIKDMTNDQISQLDPEQKTIQVFNQLRKDNLEILDAYYARELVFEDPLGKIEGLDSMKKYYAVMYDNVIDIKFEFIKTVGSGKEFFFRWKMILRSSGLRGGEPISVEGGSMIIFNDQNLVVYHRDFFDMGEMIYEHIPILRTVIKSIKGRFAH